MIIISSAQLHSYFPIRFDQHLLLQPNGQIMKKAKSSATLTTLALSLKKTIYHDSNPSAPQRPPSPEQTHKTIAALHKQIETLEKQISSNQFATNKIKTKHCEEQLKMYEQVSNQIQKAASNKNRQTEVVEGLRNRLAMIQQDHSSRQMNLEDELAQLEHHQELIHNYKYQHQPESQVLLELLAEKHAVSINKQELARLDQQINSKERELIQWRQESGFDMSDRTTKQKLLHLRMALMKVQDQANKFADAHCLLKFRQILCICLKEFSCSSGVVLTQKQLGDGMENYLCKQGLIEEYHQAVLKYRNKAKSKFDNAIVEQYFGILVKLEAVLANPRLQQQLRINQQYRRDIENARKLLIQKEDNLITQAQKIKELQQKLEEVFSNHSVVVIEHLRDTCGKYQLPQIKACLKELKKEQHRRIAEIASAFIKLKELEKRVNPIDSVFYMNEYTEVSRQLTTQENQLKLIVKQTKELTDQKIQIEEEINFGISKWKQASDAKEQLRELYRQLNQANREAQLKKLQAFRENTIKTAMKPSNSLSSLRQTVKIRPDLENKENQPRNTESKRKYSHSKFESDVLCSVTRKPSLLKLGKNSKALSLRQTNRGSLASMVLTRLAK